MTVAHSAPVYVVVDGQPFWKPEAVAAIVAGQKALLDELKTAAVDPRGDLEPWETLALMPLEWDRQRKVLEARVDEAAARYQRLADRAANATSPPRAPFVYLIAIIGTLVAVRRRPRQKG